MRRYRRHEPGTSKQYLLFRRGVFTKRQYRALEGHWRDICDYEYRSSDVSEEWTDCHKKIEQVRKDHPDWFTEFKAEMARKNILII